VIQASPRYVPPQLQHSRSRYSRYERESTEPPENQGGSFLDHLPCLVVRLGDIPRTDRGGRVSEDSSLDAYKEITYNETSAILDQCLFALAYLHEGERPIAHRDIKPENILVVHRLKGEVYVKLGDFGLSRAGSDWAIFCGTHLYLAPEIYSEPALRQEESGLHCGC
jgi:serine/threonine protein kinase